MPALPPKDQDAGEAPPSESFHPPPSLQEHACDDNEGSLRVGSGGDYRNSEGWRRECEARFVLSKPLNERRQYLDGVEAKRGKEGRSYLEEAILAEWKKKKPRERG